MKNLDKTFAWDFLLMKISELYNRTGFFHTCFFFHTNSGRR